MEIIRPAHHLKAEAVHDWKEIQDEALEMKELIKRNDFKGLYSQGYALSHAQVSNQPKDFFVLNTAVELDKIGKLEKVFGHWCIINPKLLAGDEEVDFMEACMSFPFRAAKKTKRFFNIKVEYFTPGLLGLKRHVKQLIDIPAYIIQHELDHAQGRNIYNL